MTEVIYSNSPKDLEGLDELREFREARRWSGWAWSRATMGDDATMPPELALEPLTTPLHSTRR
jgi:hypothetical protein